MTSNAAHDHFIVITDGEDENGYPDWEVGHPPDCPLIEVYEQVTDYDCPVGREIRHAGLASLCSWGQDWPDDLPKTPGKYPIEFWELSYGSYWTGSEYECGLHLNEDHEEVSA